MEEQEIEAKEAEARVAIATKPFRIDVFGYPDTFAICIRSAASDAETWPGFCGFAYSIRRVWIGMVDLDAVAGTVFCGIENILGIVNNVDHVELYKMDKSELFKTLICESPEWHGDIKHENITVYTETGWEHKLSIECECFGGFHIFGITSEKDIRLVFFNNEFPENSFDYTMKKDEVREVLLSARDFLSTQLERG
jgi:hypothetical protein